MISHISIKDFATIENTEVDFHKGLNIITGETGSGKSVLLTAMSLALGNRADSTYVRTGSEKAQIQIVAEFNHKEVIITREIASNGKNICKIDGEIVPLSKLSELCAQIADIHGQFDNQYLLNTENHILLVDKYEKNAIYPLRNKISDLYESFIEVSKRLERFISDASDNDQKKELINFQIDEIEKANLISGEDRRIEEELVLLQNKEKIYEGLSKSYIAANGEGQNALTGMDLVIKGLRDITTLSKDASELETEFSDLYYRFEDVANKLRDTRDKITFNSDDIDEMTDRLTFINELKRKYGETIDEILDHKETLEREIRSLSNIDSDIESISLEKSRIEEMLKDETARLTGLRRSSAATLQSKIQDELNNLNFNDAEILININPLPHYTNNGMDKVEFLISANVGEALKPLAKIASGGEMSRIMLALKTVIGEYDGIPTMIFDEIDSGISGETASIVGKAMNSLGRNHQIIAITHLPQIAACGDHNYRIEKSTDNANTYTTVSHLSSDGKIAEIARLLSGMNVSDITIQNAKEMISVSR